MTKTVKQNQIIRNMVEKGYTNTQIVNALGVNRQSVHNARYYVNKKRGIAGLPIMRNADAKAKNTGIASVSKPPVSRPSYIPPEFDLIERPAKKKSNKRRNAQLTRQRRERAEREALSAQSWKQMAISTGNTSLLEAIATYKKSFDALPQGWFKGLLVSYAEVASWVQVYQFVFHRLTRFTFQSFTPTSSKLSIAAFV